MSDVSVMVCVDRIALVQGERVRRWFFWKRWRTHILAEVPYAIRRGDTVHLQAIHVADELRYEVVVKHVGDEPAETVLAYGPYFADELFEQRAALWEDR